MSFAPPRPPSGHALPLGPEWTSEDEYVQSLLTFATSSDIFRNLCGGVHILDFLTREPDIYTTVLPQDWRDWFDKVTVDEVLDLLLRRDLSTNPVSNGEDTIPAISPPDTLLDYIRTVRKHCLQREFTPVSEQVSDIPIHVSVGMKVKKVHEVTNFAAYVDKLSGDLSEQFQQPISIVDFGSGQNYLGRTLASPPYNKHVIAIERKHHNIAGAREMDVHAKLAKKQKIIRNKKEWKRQLALGNGIPTPPPEESEAEQSVSIPVPDVVLADMEAPEKGEDIKKGSMTYIEHDIQDGRLEDILYPVEPKDSGREQDSILTSHPEADQSARGQGQARPKVMVVSIHSCGNLSHHGLRSLVLNPSVCAVAMIGCCYNLLTERLGPATYKLPQLRPNHPRLEATGSAYDPHGFPMSKTLEDFEHETGKGMRLNITARMMAVQAPYNWGPEDSEAFFRRHFYRSLLQRILLDLGVVKQCPDPGSLAGGSVTGKDHNGTPLIVGSLRKACFANFKAYCRGALAKLRNDPVDGPMIAELTKDLTDDMIEAYEAKWDYARKNMAVIWSLMAFSAGVVESIIVTDRWLYLREQPCVQNCWVDIVFDYKHSPRNFVVVGIKKQD
ncbi:hypothetical protein HRR83_008254 [Exophiala dermatitidis]|uniref:Methyltransferase domain-containing protein n=2 Tax=Exophiala dermatitidis TaxID=5970 RepID=H6BSG3_EXODN|nr:uncharacterized protein HMPREF1120_02346 [Exophiala dermatitidis NIH/UT8656]KAJ4507907.1 hypothetical protein HRR74_007791 [Exophiala dermatitidis]EHY54171.1 hypothetical protein HMPREF1120_02346 [Exophiala dermatitidis NIH/UT8656]KAJ4513682.1 hypothetical protein HRR73_005841 [Exophiala dermatitidis]KAJ4535470.1 hypothetical protein HRR77_007790 [Exophiala dermatitidis]KAJ4541176.1 hypothetical protein HRR78_007522 [Exophiala dermatitidis]